MKYMAWDWPALQATPKRIVKAVLRLMERESEGHEGRESGGGVELAGKPEDKERVVIGGSSW